MAKFGSIASKLNFFPFAGGRLTYSATDPLPLADALNVTTIYYLPYRSDLISLYDGVGWTFRQFTSIGMSLAGLLANTNYDIFVRWNNGFVWTANAWTNDSTRAVALSRLNGVLVASNNNQFRYLGTIRTQAAGNTADSNQYRYIHNYENQEKKTINLGDTGTGAGTIYTNSSPNVWRTVRGNNPSSNFIQAIVGNRAEVLLTATWSAMSLASNSYHQGSIYLNGVQQVNPVASPSQGAYASCVPLYNAILQGGLARLEPYELAHLNNTSLLYSGMAGLIST